MEKVNKERILVLGAGGMAGHMIYNNLLSLNKYDLYASVHSTPFGLKSFVLDVMNINDVEKIISEIEPDYIINCIGILVKDANSNPSKAIYINAYFPNKLNELSERYNYKLIHLSTDCVFSGQKGSSYFDTDFCDATDIYGRSKALGEIVNKSHLTIRTSIIGPELKPNGVGLFHWFMSQKVETDGYNTAIWGGVTTLELAKYVEFAIENKIFGLVQLSNGLGINKFELLKLINDVFDKGISINSVDKNGINKSLKASTNINYLVPSYNQMILEMKEYMLQNNITYAQYLK